MKTCGLIVALLLGNCSCAEKRGPELIRYTCAGGYRFEVELLGQEAVVNAAGKSIRLRSVAAATGAKFSDGVNTFWTKGSGADLDLENVHYRDCLAGK